MSARIPLATYRLQLHPQNDQGRFDFRDAQKAAPYLARLGVDTLYLSPIWQATPHSTHGYDVTDHAQVSAELGGEKGLLRLHAAARELGLGLLADFVPNHMGIASGHNPYWEDVLKHGQASRYAHFFDISWQPLRPALSGKVLLPTLGDQYGRVLERGELQLERQGGAFMLRYFERLFPLSPRSYAPLLQHAAAQFAPQQPLNLELASLAVQAANLPDSLAPLTDQARELRAQETAVLERRIALLGQQKSVQHALNAACAHFNADATALNSVLQQQNYRLSYWRVASEQINYRRFFDINDLAALRIEDPKVFDWAHQKLLELIARGVIVGLRLDHTDGLYDPATYFHDLQAAAGQALNLEYIHQERARDSEESASATNDPRPLYLLAEKILEPGEALPNWPIHGTTGYDFLAQVGGLFVEGQNEDEFSGLYRRFTGDTLSYGQTLHATKLLIERTSLASEVQVLAEQLQSIAEADLRWQDLTLRDLLTALREVVACFPVYRTYLRPDGSREAGDNAKIEKAISDARRYSRDLDGSLFEFLRAVLLLDAPDEPSLARYTRFALKFQQLTGPVTAKGAEDTAFYRYGRLLSLNEVGGDPALFGNPVRTFHAQCRARAEHWPQAMLGSSTHDTKRGEDTRARISVLSEMPQTWAAHLSHWSRLARPFIASLEGGSAPSSADLNIFFQTVLGIWPLDGNTAELPQRLSRYMLKVVREAKDRSSWARPDEEYEAALSGLVSGLLANDEFTASVQALHQRISPYGAQNSLSAALIRLMAPGVPDIYQGSEGWNQSLVDPDNRRPVDYPQLSRRLARLESRWLAAPLNTAQQALDNYHTGEVKLLLTWLGLQARRQHPELFLHGDYQALGGGKHLVAFARHHAHPQHGAQTLVTVAPRLTYTLTREQSHWALGESWGTRTLKLPSGRYRNLLTGERFTVRGGTLALAKLLEFFPLALLLKES